MGVPPWPAGFPKTDAGTPGGRAWNQEKAHRREIPGAEYAANPRSYAPKAPPRPISACLTDIDAGIEEQGGGGGAQGVGRGKPISAGVFYPEIALGGSPGFPSSDMPDLLPHAVVM